MYMYILDVTCLHESDHNFIFLSPNELLYECDIKSRFEQNDVYVCAFGSGYWIVDCELFVHVTQ